jgi:hypothetical protein
MNFNLFFDILKTYEKSGCIFGPFVSVNLLNFTPAKKDEPIFAAGLKYKIGLELSGFDFELGYRYIEKKHAFYAGIKINPIGLPFAMFVSRF